MIIENLCGLIYVATALTCIWSLAILRRFLAETPSIADEGSLERFKNLARVEMYATLLLLVILMPATVIVMVLSAHRGPSALAAVIVTNFGLWALGWALGRYHGQV